MKLGDKSKAICQNCKKEVSTTMKHKSLKVGSVKNEITVLAGVCDNCSEVISIPHSQSKKIGEFIKSEKL